MPPPTKRSKFAASAFADNEADDDDERDDGEFSGNGGQDMDGGQDGEHFGHRAAGNQEESLGESVGDGDSEDDYDQDNLDEVRSFIAASDESEDFDPAVYRDLNEPDALGENYLEQIAVKPIGSSYRMAEVPFVGARDTDPNVFKVPVKRAKRDLCVLRMTHQVVVATAAAKQLLETGDAPLMNTAGAGVHSIISNPSDPDHLYIEADSLPCVERLCGAFPDLVGQFLRTTTVSRVARGGRRRSVLPPARIYSIKTSQKPYLLNIAPIRKEDYKPSTFAKLRAGPKAYRGDICRIYKVHISSETCDVLVIPRIASLSGNQPPSRACAPRRITEEEFQAALSGPNLTLDGTAADGDLDHDADERRERGLAKDPTGVSKYYRETIFDIAGATGRFAQKTICLFEGLQVLRGIAMSNIVRLTAAEYTSAYPERCQLTLLSDASGIRAGSLIQDSEAKQARKGPLTVGSQVVVANYSIPRLTRASGRGASRLVGLGEREEPGESVDQGDQADQGEAGEAGEAGEPGEAGTSGEADGAYGSDGADTAADGRALALSDTLDIHGASGVVTQVPSSFSMRNDIYGVRLSGEQFTGYADQMIPRRNLVRYVRQGDHVEVMTSAYEGVTGKVVYTDWGTDCLMVTIKVDGFEEVLGGGSADTEAVGDDPDNVVAVREAASWGGGSGGTSAHIAITSDEISPTNRCWGGLTKVRVLGLPLCPYTLVRITSTNLDGLVTALSYTKAKVVSSEGEILYLSYNQFTSVRVNRSTKFVRDGQGNTIGRESEVEILSSANPEDVGLRGTILAIGEQNPSILFIRPSVDLNSAAFASQSCEIRAVDAKATKRRSEGRILLARNRRQMRGTEGLSIGQRVMSRNRLHMGTVGVLVWRNDSEGQVQAGESRFSVPLHELEAYKSPEEEQQNGEAGPYGRGSFGETGRVGGMTGTSGMSGFGGSGGFGGFGGMNRMGGMGGMPGMARGNDMRDRDRSDYPYRGPQRGWQDRQNAQAWGRGPSVEGDDYPRQARADRRRSRKDRDYDQNAAFGEGRYESTTFTSNYSLTRKGATAVPEADSASHPSEASMAAREPESQASEGGSTFPTVPDPEGEPMMEEGAVDFGDDFSFGGGFEDGAEGQADGWGEGGSPPGESAELPA